MPATPELIGGSADLTRSNLTFVKGMGTVSAGNFAGRYIHYGIREHGMTAANNGMALHGGLIPYTGTFFVFTDYMRPAIRIGAITRAQVIHVLTHDSSAWARTARRTSRSNTSPACAPCRNLHVYRPADAMETAECWELAIRRHDGPSLLVLSRQALPTMRTEFAENLCARGGYVLAEADGPRVATVIGTGSEVAIAMAARESLAGEGISVAVVSLPCWELFSSQDEAYRMQVLGGAPRIGIEAASGFGWERWLGNDGIFIGMSDFGASAPYEDLYKHFGITAEAVVAAVRKQVG